MAIKNIPTINGPSYGGVIYGLTINQQFSQSPSKLKLSIVNKDGRYSNVALNSAQRVKFGSFSFNGVVWSSRTSLSADQSVLEVELIDKSIILDRTYVVLWKRGLFGILGKEISKKKEISFENESILVPKYVSQGYSQVMVFEEKNLESQSVTRRSRSFKEGKIIGSAIVLGEEDFADSSCDIPETYYYFNNLTSLLPFKFSGAPKDSTIKGSYEGTLREVLNNWCSDFGYDYYWDFSSDTLIFYDVSRGITGRLPDSTAPNIISKEATASMEGTYRQYGVAFTQKPKSSVKEINLSKTLKSYITINPVSISRFITKSGIGGSFKEYDSPTLGNRDRGEILKAAFAGYVSRSLRDLYCYSQAQYSPLGIDITKNSWKEVDRAPLLDLLKKVGYIDTIQSLEEFDAPGLPNYIPLLINYDAGLADSIFETEQSILGKIGKWYRIPSSSGTSFYCTSNSVVEVTTSVDPEGTVQEDDNEDFAGRKMYDRGGQMSHDSNAIHETLNLNAVAQEIQNSSPIIIDLKESGIDQYLIDASIMEEGQFNSAVLIPNETLLNRLQFKIAMSRGANQMEKTWKEARDAGDSGKSECYDYEKKLEGFECISAEEEARQKAMKQAYPEANAEPEELFSGLENNTADRCTVSIKGANASFFGPSDGQMRVVTTVNIEAKKISSNSVSESRQFLFSEGSIGKADDVAEIRVAMDNITSSSADEFSKKRSESFHKARNINASSPTRTISYVFAGDPPSGLSLSPKDGLSSLDVTFSSDGFTTSATYSTRGPKPAKNSSVLRAVNSQLNRSSFNGQ
jgi:hypothetical protein